MHVIGMHENITNWCQSCSLVQKLRKTHLAISVSGLLLQKIIFLTMPMNKYYQLCYLSNCKNETMAGSKYCLSHNRLNLDCLKIATCTIATCHNKVRLLAHLCDHHARLFDIKISHANKTFLDFITAHFVLYNLIESYLDENIL